MKFSIRDIAMATTAIASMLAIAKLDFGLFLFGFVFAQLFLFVGPFAILFTTIAFADQRGGFLDISSNPCYRTLKRLWLLSVGCVIVVWAFLIVGARL